MNFLLFFVFSLDINIKALFSLKLETFLDIKNVIEQCETRCHRFIIIIKCILFILIYVDLLH